MIAAIAGDKFTAPFEIVTVAVAKLLVPPAPLQVKEYDVVTASAAVLWLPLVLSVPLQPPDAVHDDALVELHVSIEVPPVTTTVGYATNVAVGMTLTRTVDGPLVPPVPVHVTAYEVGIAIAPVDCVPLVTLVPLQPPEAVHEVAFVEFQVSVEEPPLATVVGFAVSVTVGAGITTTVAPATLLVPPVPLHVKVYDVLAASAPVLSVPLVALLPLQPSEAVQDAAFVELQVNVEAPPLAMEVGLAVSMTVGAGTTMTVALATLLVPPVPVHVKEYDVLAVRAPVLSVPLVALVPLQPSEAVQDAAFVELQVSVEVPPLAMEVGLAVSVTVGAGITVTVAVATLLVPPAPVQVIE